jgi:hypothetical protein
MQCKPRDLANQGHCRGKSNAMIYDISMLLDAVEFISRDLENLPAFMKIGNIGSVAKHL